MGTTITNGGKVDRMSEFQQAIFKISGKPQFVYADWENISGKPLNEMIAYWKRSASHYERVRSELNPGDPVEYWALKFMTDKAIDPAKCEWVAGKFEELATGFAKYDQDTGFGDEYKWLGLEALLMTHVEALRKCAEQGVGFRYHI